MERPKIIVIEWEDPNSSAGWTDPLKVEDMDPSIVVSVGMLVKENAQWLWLCMDWAKDGEVNTLGRVRQDLIKARKELKLPRGIWKETYIKVTKKQLDEAPEMRASTEVPGMTSSEPSPDVQLSSDEV